MSDNPVINPTIGRRVWYWPDAKDRSAMSASDITQPCDAGVIYVHNARCVNLDITDHAGRHHARTSVRLLQDGEKPLEGEAHAQWMPYQQGQAKKDAVPIVTPELGLARDLLLQMAQHIASEPGQASAIANGAREAARVLMAPLTDNGVALANLSTQTKAFADAAEQNLVHSKASLESLTASGPATFKSHIDGAYAAVQTAVAEEAAAITPASEQQIEAMILAKGLVAPRLKPLDLDANIIHSEIVKCTTHGGQVLRWAILTTRNGFAVTGRPSASVSPENDNAEIGEQVAKENARSELWPLMGYALRERLYSEPKVGAGPG